MTLREPSSGDPAAPRERTTAPVWCIVLAAGGGARFGGAKQFALLAGETLLRHGVRAAAAACDGVVVVLPAGCQSGELPPPAAEQRVTAHTVVGGATRSASVRAGLAALPAQVGVVVLHDAAHPLAGGGLFAAVIDAVRGGAAAAIPGLPVTDAIKRVDGGRVVATVGRAGLVAAQMPQAFRADLLRAVHTDAPEAVEDSALIEAAGHAVVVVDGDPANVHVTTRAELTLAARLAVTAPAPGGAPPATA